VFGKVNNATGTSTKGISIAGNADVTFWNDVTNTSGLFKVNSGSTATFFGAFSGNGITGNAADIHFEGGVSPGFSPASVTFAGNVSLGGAATLLIELGGLTQGSQYDHVEVTGQLTLDGILNVALLGPFVPTIGSSFHILDWGNVVGTFATLQLPALAGGPTWDTSQLYTTGTLSVGGVLGDYNHNGVVDAPDYVVWRKGLGTTYTQNDYNIWRANFGATAGGGSGSALGPPSPSAVPEPACLVLMLIGMIGLLAGRAAAGHRPRKVLLTH
jgi:hypothetical protein